MLFALLLALFSAGPDGAPPADPVVATVGAAEVHVSAVRRHLADPSEEGIAAAVVAACQEAALAQEARAQLGAGVAGLSDAEAATRLLERLFDPAVRCARIPEGERRRYFATERWRFEVPPTYVVDDLQLLCCTSPLACRDPDVAACINDTAAEAQRLRERLPDHLDAAAFDAAFDLAALDEPRLGARRYSLHFDPDRPDARLDRRLHVVDRPIAEAVAALPSPGAVSPVVETRFGHHILRLVEVRPALHLAWDDPRAQELITAGLCPGRLAAERARYVKDLLAPMGIRVRPDAAALVTAPGRRAPPAAPTAPRGPASRP